MEKEAMPDPSQKVPKNEEIWMNGNILMQQRNENYLFLGTFWDGSGIASFSIAK